MDEYWFVYGKTEPLSWNLISIVINWCQLLSIIVNYCQLMSIDVDYWKTFSFKHECLNKSTWLQITPGIHLVSFVSSVGRPVSLLRQRYRRVWPFPQGCGVGDRRQSWENPAGGVCAGERHREELKLRRCFFLTKIYPSLYTVKSWGIAFRDLHVAIVVSKEWKETVLCQAIVTRLFGIFSSDKFSNF